MEPPAESIRPGYELNRYELSSSMGEAVRQQNLHPRIQLRNIARERVAHLNGRARVRRTLLQHVGEVLAGMLASGEERPRRNSVSASNARP